MTATRAHVLTLVPAALFALFALGLPAPASAALPAPTGLHLGASSLNSIQWVWNAYPEATAYRLSVSTHPDMRNAKVGFTKTRFTTVTHLQRGTAYYAGVRAVTADGLSDLSSIVRVRTNEFVQNLRVISDNEFFTDFIWAGRIHAYRYEFRISSREDMKYARSLIEDDKRSHVHSLDYGTTYYSQVRALNSAGTPITPWSPKLAYYEGAPLPGH